MEFYVGTAEADKFQFNKSGLMRILKVIGWSCGSTLVATLITLLPQIDFPTMWLWAVPIVNTLLVAIQQFITKNR